MGPSNLRLRVNGSLNRWGIIFEEMAERERTRRRPASLFLFTAQLESDRVLKSRALSTQMCLIHKEDFRTIEWSAKDGVNDRPLLLPQHLCDAV
jgi:hypothetical protein